MKLAYPERHLRVERTTVGVTTGDGHSVVGIGRYFVLRLLGKGGMGAVYLAYDPDLSRKVAIKVLRQDVMRMIEPSLADAHRARMVREAKSLARLSHANVVPVFAVGELPDQSFYIAMEYIDGRSLRDVLRDGLLDWRACLELVLQAGDGLAAAHQAGILHRDFKPDNILVGRDGVVRILDFGLARVVNESDDVAPSLDDQAQASEQTGEAVDTDASITQSGIAMGTPGYMSPEQLRGADVDERSDIFAFCCVLFEALTLQRPFPAIPVHARISAITAGELHWPPTIPKWLGKRIAKGLALDPNQRGSDLASLIAEIRQGFAHEERVRKRWTRAALLTVLVAAAVPGVRVTATMDQPECVDPALALAEVWNPKNRGQLLQGFASFANPMAKELGQQAITAINRWQDRWVNSALQLCPSAMPALAVLDPAQREQSRACLAESRAQVAALVGLWALPTLQQVLESPHALHSLSAPEDCLRPEILRDRAPLPPELSRRQQVLQLREQLEQANVLTEQAAFERASSRLQALRSDVVRSEDLPMLAEYFAGEARLADESTYHDLRASAPLMRSYLWSVAADRPQLAADAIHWACFIAAYRAIQVDLALELLNGQIATVKRAGDPSDMLGRVARNRGVLALLQGHFPVVLSQLLQQLHHVKMAHGEHSLQAAKALDDLGYVALAMHHYPQALAYFQRALAIVQQRVPPGYPFRVQLLTFLGEAYVATGESGAARMIYLDAIGECSAAGLPPEACSSPYVAIAILDASTGHWAQASVEVAMWQQVESKLGRRIHRALPWSEHILAKVLSERGEVEVAQELSARALARLAAEANVHPQAWAHAFELSAGIALAAQDLPQAQHYVSRLSELLLVPSEFRDRYIWKKYQIEAEIHRLAGRTHEAILAGEIALDLAQSAQVPSFELARLGLSLAQAVAQSGALELARNLAYDAWTRVQSDRGIAQHLELAFCEVLAQLAVSDREPEVAMHWILRSYEVVAVDEVLPPRLATLAHLEERVRSELRQAIKSGQTTSRQRAG